MTFDDIERASVLAVGLFVSIYVVFPQFARSALRISNLPVSTGGNRFGCIDGLHGVLAIGVVTHHVFTAREYFLAGRWHWSSSPVLNHLRQSIVAVFFIVTGHLFALKATKRTIDWTSLFCESLRVRLVPLHSLVVCVGCGFRRFARLSALEGTSVRAGFGRLLEEM